MIELMPSWFDPYAALLADAKKRGPAKVKLVKAPRRERAELLLIDALMMLRFTSPSFVQPEHGVESTPNFYDLIEPQLERFPGLVGRN